MKSALVLMPFFIKISFDFFPPAMAPQTMIEVLPLLKDGARHSLLYFFQCLAPYSGLRGQPADFKTRHVCLDHLSPVVYCPVLVFFFFCKSIPCFLLLFVQERFLDSHPTSISKFFQLIAYSVLTSLSAD